MKQRRSQRVPGWVFITTIAFLSAPLLVGTVAGVATVFGSPIPTWLLAVAGGIGAAGMVLLVGSAVCDAYGGRWVNRAYRRELRARYGVDLTALEVDDLGLGRPSIPMAPYSTIHMETDGERHRAVTITSTLVNGHYDIEVAPGEWVGPARLPAAEPELEHGRAQRMSVLS